MKARHAIITMLFIVSIFVSKGLYTSNLLKTKIDNSYKEFEVVTNTLSPLFDSYGIGLVDNQVKVSHDLITIDQYKNNLEKINKSQHSLLNEYKKSVLGKETVEDKELFMLSQAASDYKKKVQFLAAKGDIKEIHNQLYNGEMYRVIDPITEIINKVLDNKFHAAEQARKAALDELKAYERVVYFTVALTIILGVALFRCDKKYIVHKKSSKKK